MQVSENAPNPIDVHVGTRIRLRRKFERKSQGDLAAALNMTFQQVQKYERGSNRISASKLYQAAKYLRVSVAYFFQGISDRESENDLEISDTEDAINSFLATSEGLEIASAFPRIKSSSHRRKILNLVQSLADDAD